MPPAFTTAVAVASRVALGRVGGRGYGVARAP